MRKLFNRVVLVSIFLSLIIALGIGIRYAVIESHIFSKGTQSDHQKLKQLREQYPFYSDGLSGIHPLENIQIVPITFKGRINSSDYIVAATITDDPEKIAVPIGNPVESTEFINKHPSADSVNVYLYPIQVDRSIAGKDVNDSYWVFIRERYLESYPTPRKGDKFYYLLRHSEGLVQYIAYYKNIEMDEVISGIPVFYITDEDKVLSILDNEDMTKYDMTNTKSFDRILRKMWKEGKKR